MEMRKLGAVKKITEHVNYLNFLNDTPLKILFLSIVLYAYLNYSCCLDLIMALGLLV